MSELSDEERDRWNEEVLNWCDREIDKWTNWIQDHKNPCYRPMSFLYTKKKVTMANMLMDLKLSDVIKSSITGMIKAIEKKYEDEVIGVMYYFHTNEENQNPDQQFVVKRTVLRFHLFSKFKEKMLGHLYLSVILYEGQGGKMEDDVVYVEPLKDHDYIVHPSMKPLFTNPFFI